MDKDTIIGTAKEIGGKVRSAVGHATGDKEGETRGALDEARGNLQKNYGKAKDTIKDLAKASSGD